MLLTSTVIVLREVLEAALLIAILAAVARSRALAIAWVWGSVVAGAAGALGFAMAFRQVAEWFGGVGYEVGNAALQIMVYALLLPIAAGIGLTPGRTDRTTPGESPKEKPEKNPGENPGENPRETPGDATMLTRLMGAAIALAVVREGSEIALYLSGVLLQPQGLGGNLIGCVLGAGVGFSMGALLYYLLCAGLAAGQSTGRTTWARRGVLLLLALVSGSLCSQATQLLIQANWLPASLPLWDSSGWLPEGSVAGQLLYALVGYEATPGPLVVTAYLTSAAGLLGAAVLGSRTGRAAR